MSDIASRLGLGLAAIGRPAYITVGRGDDLGDGSERSVDAMRERAHRLLEGAWALGIRYFDAARSYGLAEEFLGSWLAEHPGRRDEVTIGSKWGYEYVGGWQLDAEVQERKEHSLRMLARQWPETQGALGGEPDVYLVHSLTTDSPLLGDAALLDELRRIASTGVRVGFSTSGPSQSAVIDAALALPDTPFSAVQTTWNLLEQSAAPALARANDARWLVVVKESLANGRLTARGAAAAAAAADPSGTAPARPRASASGAAEVPAEAEVAASEMAAPEVSAPEVAAARLAADDGQPLAGLALGAALAHPWADIVLTGAVTGAQLLENLAARAPRTDEQALAALAEPPAQYWSERSARAWT